MQGNLIMDKRECIRKIMGYFTDQDDVSTVLKEN